MHVLAIDQGTTGTTAVLVNTKGRITAKAYREHPQIYPQPGWVEHDPLAIWESVRECVREVTQTSPGRIAAVGITNQRETTILWDRNTGEPVHNAIAWQCRRTAPLCEALRPHADLFRARTGLPVDPYFSGTKIRWLLEHGNVGDAGELLFGTVDTWLIWKLTGGQVHATDYTNASRTLLVNIETKAWDAELCDLLSVPREILPDIRKSVDDYGKVTTIPELDGVPILGVAGDQQAALFGQTCFARGTIKNTYGTGCFLLMNTGAALIRSSHGLVTTLAVDETGGPCYAIEGSVFVAGAAIQWLRDELRILDNAAESEAAARSLKGNDGVYLVPAFTGLGAPHWAAEARGTLVGLTRGTNRNHLIRAALEAMAYQSYDVFEAMSADSGLDLTELAVDGGATANNFLMEFQAGILNRPVVRPSVIESTSFGAACLAGLGAGAWGDADELTGLRVIDRRFEPTMAAATREALLDGWRRAVRQTMAG